MTNVEHWTSEIDASLSGRNEAQVAGLLQQITDWFLAGATTLSEEHVAIFDDVMGRLIERIERETLVELSERLAPIDNAPPGVIGRLSRSDDIAVSGPLLEQSPVLTDPDLVEIAQTKGQSHLSAIAGRQAISEMVTAVLFGRGDSDVARKVTENPGARISRHTFESVVKRARQDAGLTVAVADRKDLPQELFEQLIREATATVRQRLLTRASPEMRQRIAQVLTRVAERVSREPVARIITGGAKNLIPLDLIRLRARVMQAVKARQSAEMIDALAVLGQVPVKAVNELIKQGSAEGLIALGKTGGMSWPDLQEVLKAALPGPATTGAALNALFDTYARLTPPKAQIAVSYIRTTKAVSRTDIARLM
jgi:uncharacterized protein (DUF2336 family)